MEVFHHEEIMNGQATTPTSQMPSTSELASTILDIAETSSTTSSAMTKSVKPEVEKVKASKEGKPRMSRMKQLLEKRHAHNEHKIVLGTRRQKLLEEAKEKMRQSEYESKREINPWRFKNPRLDRKYNFVNNLVTTQEMLVLVDEAKERSRRKPDEESTPGSSLDTRVDVSVSVDCTSNEEETQRADDELQTEEVTEENTDEELPEKNNNSKSTSEECEECSSEKEDDENDDSNKNTILCAEGRIERVKLRKRKWKKSRASSASSTIIYAFGSTHNKGLCNYCGSLRCKGQINRTRMNINAKNVDKIGQRISDVRGIYQGDRWKTSNNQKMLDRVNILDKELNRKLLNSRSSLQSSKK